MRFLNKSFFLGCFILIASPLVFATELVLDSRNVAGLPKNFRKSTQTLPSDINSTGLSNLHIAGGAQFSKLSLQSLLQQLPAKKLTIIDLRQESHGFLNGNAISWYARGNSANAGLSSQQIEAIQSRLLRELEEENLVKVGVILSKAPNERIDKKKGVEFAVYGVSSEAELAEKSGLNYERLYVEDFHAPTTKQVDRFIQIVRELSPDHWIYFHCRAGIGRTTTFMAMYDMLKNAKQVPFDDILARQVALGGKDLAESTERLKFLKRFYEYAKENKDNFDTSFAAWSRRNSSS